MINLLYAHLFRLRKSLLFWTALLVSAGLGAWAPWNIWQQFGQFRPSLDSVFFLYAMIIGILLAVFLSLFFGAEYSDGAIRNKLAIGHTRLAVYLSNLTASVLTALIFCGTYLLFMLAVGVPLLGTPKAPADMILTTLIGSLFMAAAFCSIYTSIIMNFSRKAAAAVSCMLLFLALFINAMNINDKLNAPEFSHSFELVNGEMESELIRNPNLLDENERPVYEFLLDLNPMGQAMQYHDCAPTRPVQLALCSLGVIAVATGAGFLLFRRKDLK